MSLDDTCDDLLGAEPVTNAIVAPCFPRSLDACERAFEKLDGRERYFVDLVHNGLTCTEAADRAGYASSEAADIGQILYNRPYIQKALQWLQVEWLKRRGITQERVLQEYANIAFSDLADVLDENGKLLPLRRIPKHARAALASFEVSQTDFNGASTVTLAKIKAISKLPALDSLARILDVTVDKLELTGANGGAIEVNATLNLSDNEKARRVAFLMLREINKPKEVIEHEQ